MTINISFSGVPFYFFSGPTHGNWQNSPTAQSSILPFAVEVTASIEGPNADKFGGLKLTAWGPFQRFVPNPQPPELPVGSRQVRAGSVVTFYEMTGTSASDGTPTTPLLVNAGGYVEISASALPWPKKGPWPTQGNNRFVANIIVTGIAGTGTNWNPISLVLNVVDGELSGNLNFGELSGGTWIVLSSPSFQAGQSYPMAIKWSTSNTPSLWPPSQDDYPIYFGVGDAILVPGQLYISPPGLMTWWTGPAGTGPSDAGHTLEAYSTVIVDPSAPSVQDQPLNVLQSFYNNSLVFQSGSIGYSITA